MWKREKKKKGRIQDGYVVSFDSPCSQYKILAITSFLYDEV